MYLDWMLYLQIQSCFAQPVGERILIHLFQMTMTVIGMDVIRRLADLIGQFLYILHIQCDLTT